MKRIVHSLLWSLCGVLALGAVAHASFDAAVEEGTQAYHRGDFLRAYRLWQEPAAQGDHRAQFLLSTLYEEGQGVSKDLPQALRWLTSSAEGGFAPAQFNLGNNYYHGAGVNQDYAKATAWWLRSAENDFVQAQYNLGVAYVTGKGVEQDNSAAAHWFLQAAQGGSEPAQKILEEMGIDPRELEALGERRDASTQAGLSSPPPQVRPTATTATATPRSGLLDSAWLRSQHPDHYTVQVFSTGDRQRAQEFAGQIAQTHPVALYPFSNRGGEWYRVVVGSFSSKAAAEQAMSRMPLQEWRTNGLPSRFGDVQRVMRN